MITGKGLPVEQDLILPPSGLVETSEQQVQINSQGVHSSDFIRLSADDLGHGRGRLLREKLPGSERRVLEISEVAGHRNR